MSDEVVVRVADAEVIRGQDGFSPIFSSEAIPGGHLVRVEDVNGPHEFNVLDGERGKTGATGAKGDKGDPGNYTKPDSGIPKTDLSSAVQASLDKADTAIQLGLTGASVGDLVRVAAVDANGKPTSWNHVPLCDIVTNENLVDNGNFFNAVNQRGQGSYPNPGYCIDRWSKGTGGSINSIGPTYGMLVTPGTSIIQAFESGLKSSLDGKVCTLSVAITSGSALTVYYGTFSYQSVPSATISVFSNSNMKGEIGTDGKLYIIWQASFNYGIAAVKLELGSEQTLAHQENGAWVLNEIPDYGQELAKCQRYLLAYKSGILCTGQMGSSGKDIYLCLPTPTVLRAAPGNISGYGLQIYGNAYQIPAEKDIDWYDVRGACLLGHVSFDSTQNIPANSCVNVQINKSGGILLSAEL